MLDQNTILTIQLHFPKQEAKNYLYLAPVLFMEVFNKKKVVV